MSGLSHLHKLANLISVSDVCTPFISNFDSDRSVSDVWEEWFIDLCGQHDLDPMEQIGLVTTLGKVVGWITFDMLDLEYEKRIIDCYDKIDTDAILSSDTSLIVVIEETNDIFGLALKPREILALTGATNDTYQ
ncbi:hypothetical protein HQ563_06740 [bacterium]|nr:hypothetical protein [bacterium]